MVILVVLIPRLGLGAGLLGFSRVFLTSPSLLIIIVFPAFDFRERRVVLLLHPLVITADRLEAGATGFARLSLFGALASRGQFGGEGAGNPHGLNRSFSVRQFP